MGQKTPNPPQHQKQQPGLESEMDPRPIFDDPSYPSCGRLLGLKALITGGDSGIGRAVAVAFAREGADVFIVYLNEHDDAAETKRYVEEKGRKCELLAGDIGDPEFCAHAVKQCVKSLGGLDVLVNNAAEQHLRDAIEEISPEQVERTFRTNIFSMFYLTAAALPHMKEGSTIINSTSVTAYQGHPQLIDYAATKGAIVAFTRSLSQNLSKRKIRVNAVAPGPIWTPLIPATFPAEKTAQHGSNKPLGGPGQPVEVAPSYVFLASRDATYISGQVLHPNGGVVVNG